MKRFIIVLVTALTVVWGGTLYAASVVPPVIDLPGTQPSEVGNLESPDKCDNCHGGYNISVEPAHNWRGSMMANAGRDPIFWATLAIAEQDFDGAGDLCIRCHSTGGWIAGRSTPTDGSGLAAGDSDGVECDYCHKMTNPNNTEHLGEQNLFFPANDPENPTIGFYGSGMGSLWGGSEKLGPYSDAEARHQFMQSQFHRDVDFCGSCHDVSNSAVGHYALNHGAQPGGETIVTNGSRAHPADQVPYVGLNNPPYRYGIVERTFSEYKAGLWPTTLVSDYNTLPPELQAGAVKAGYESAIVAGTGGNYADGTPRYFSCQTCHLRPVNGPGCNKQGVPNRKDLPLHDMTGGNYWMPEAIQYLDSVDKLRLGGDLTDIQEAALDAGAVRAKKQLNEAVTIEIIGATNTVKVTNLTGHKLITGYPEGRRMWLRTTWYDAKGSVLRVDGEYGPLYDPDTGQLVTVVNPATGQPVQVKSLINPYDSNTKVYEAHYGLDQAWAAALDPGCVSTLPLSYDRYTGLPDFTLGQLACAPPGTEHETFHFVLNNVVVKDDRIPPYGMSYDVAKARNALPVPDNQYGGSPGGTYDHYDLFDLNPPSGAASAEVELLYQPTSWEYIQFLALANTGQNAFLADEGVNMLEAWLNTGMAEPYVMASTVWGKNNRDFNGDGYADILGVNSAGKLWWYDILGDTWVNVSGFLENVVVGNFDADNISDIAGLNASGQIWWYDVDGAAWHNISGSLASIVAGDFNGDGYDDIAGLNASGQIWWYDVDGAAWHNISGSLASLVAGDFNGDGNDDIAGLNASGQIWWYDVDGAAWYNIPGTMESLVVGDFDGVGSEDLAGLNVSGQIWYTTDGSTWQNIQGSMVSLIVGDYDHDGDDDLAGLNASGMIWYTTDLSIWQNIPGSLEELY
jgi:hypothetical protein